MLAQYHHFGVGEVCWKEQHCHCGRPRSYTSRPRRCGHTVVVVEVNTHFEGRGGGGVVVVVAAMSCLSKSPLEIGQLGVRNFLADFGTGRPFPGWPCASRGSDATSCHRPTDPFSRACGGALLSLSLPRDPTFLLHDKHRLQRQPAGL